MSEATIFAGTFHWIPAAENGPTVPFEHDKMTAFAYVEPRPDIEGAVLIHGLPGHDADGDVEARWIPGYPIPGTNRGDVVTVIASQRPIATITVTRVGDNPSRK